MGGRSQPKLSGDEASFLEVASPAVNSLPTKVKKEASVSVENFLLSVLFRRHFCHLITLEGNFPRPACCVPCVLNSVTVLTKRKKVIESVKMSNKHLMISPPSNNNLDNCKMDSGAPGASDASQVCVTLGSVPKRRS